MKIIANLKLCEENLARKINIAGKATFIFANAGAITVSAGSSIVCPDAHDSKLVYVEVTLENHEALTKALRKEKRFDSIYKFFDILVGSRTVNMLNYIQSMGIIDEDYSYGVSTYDMVMPSAEDACMDVKMEFTSDVTPEEVEDMDIVALYIRTDKPYDILLPLYPQEFYVNNAAHSFVSCEAKTYDEECERLNPDDYQTVLDSIDDIIKMNNAKVQILAVDSTACCGNEVDISETCYPVDKLELNFVRHGKTYSIDMKGVHA